MQYRELQTYKYQLTKRFSIKIPNIGTSVSLGPITLEDNVLSLEAGYSWNGASGPTIDTADTMRGSLVHDALYQLIRMKLLTLSYKPIADNLFKDILRQDGMSKFRSEYFYQAVRVFGKLYLNVR